MVGVRLINQNLSKMNREEFEELFEETDSDLKNVKGDSCMLGLMIIAKYITYESKPIIKGAAHDVVYSVDVDDLVEAGITEEDTKNLAIMNWCIDEDNDCLMSFV
jgi:hypothetical protein